MSYAERDFEKISLMFLFKVCLEKGWNSKQMITEGEAAILMETTRRAFRDQENSKQRSVIVAKKKKFNFEYLAVMDFLPRA